MASYLKQRDFQLFVCPSGLAVNQDLYGEECIRKRLIPFIKKYHSQDEFIFWPDLASSHYAESVCDIYIEERINFVEKYENPANLPECRPIEKFWAILKGRVYANNWKAKDLEQLRKRVELCINEIEKELVTKLMEGMIENLKTVARKGVIEKR